LADAEEEETIEWAIDEDIARYDSEKLTSAEAFTPSATTTKCILAFEAGLYLFKARGIDIHGKADADQDSQNNNHSHYLPFSAFYECPIPFSLVATRPSIY